METSLYHRLGELDGITKIVDDILANHYNNPAINARYLPLKDDPVHEAEVRQHVIEFLAMGSGGPVDYTGKDMPSTHKGMNINQGEYMEVIDDIMAALDKHNIDEPTKNEVLAICYSLKGEMVHK